MSNRNIFLVEKGNSLTNQQKQHAPLLSSSTSTHLLASLTLRVFLRPSFQYAKIIEISLLDQGQMS